MSVIKLLLVEDEPNFGVVLKDTLELRDFSVTHAKDGDEGLRMALNQDFDLAILDVMLPKMSGFELAERLQDMQPDLPFIFLTARTMKEDQIQGFKLGASDYINKPFEPEILVLRIQAALKKTGTGVEKPNKDSYVFAQYTYIVASRKLLFSDGTEVKLSPREGELFQLLLENKDKVVDRDLALMKIWGEDSYFTSRSMDVYIAKLRKYFIPKNSVNIENVHGKGFMLTVQND